LTTGGSRTLRGACSPSPARKRRAGTGTDQVGRSRRRPLLRSACDERHIVLREAALNKARRRWFRPVARNRFTPSIDPPIRARRVAYMRTV